VRTQALPGMKRTPTATAFDELRWVKPPTMSTTPKVTVSGFGAATPNTEDEEDMTGHVQPPRDVDGLPPHSPIA
jgi:hypothetical protein